MDDITIISLLSTSYSRQLRLYEELILLVNKTVGQLALSRGNVAAVMGDFDKKQKLIDAIADERSKISAPAELWHKRKHDVAPSPALIELENLLAKTERAIKAFLEVEDQLKRYLEHASRQPKRV
jgi:hypothetical protein